MLGKGSLLGNVLSNSGGYVASVLIAFVITPVIVRSLGDEGYGIWSLVSEVIGYYGLLDLGIRGAVTHFTARYLAMEDRSNQAGSIATGFWALASLGAFVLILGTVIALLFPHLFRVGEIPVDQVRSVMLIMSAAIAFGMPMSVFSGVLVGHQRLDLVNGIEIGTSLIGAIAIYFSMKNGGGLVSLALIRSGIAMASWAITLTSLRKIMSGLSIRPKAVSKRSLIELWHYGGRSMVINLAILIVYRTDLLVVGAFMGPAWVTLYSIGQMLVRYLSSAGSAITRSFTPRMTQLASQGDEPELKRVYLLGTWTAACLVAPLAGCMLAFGKSFIALWLGEGYVSGTFWERSDVIMVLLLAAQVPRVLQSSSWQLLFATRRQGYLARLTIFEAVLNLSLSIVLVQCFGIVGVAFGTLAPMLITHLILMPRFISRNFGITIRKDLARAVGPQALVGAGLWAIGTLLTRLVTPDDWATFFAEASLTAAVGLVLLYVFALDESARKDLAGLAARMGGRST